MPFISHQTLVAGELKAITNGPTNALNKKPVTATKTGHNIFNGVMNVGKNIFGKIKNKITKTIKKIGRNPKK